MLPSYETIWAPKKCKIFTWLLVQHRLPTADVLSIRHMPNNHWCPLCTNNPETGLHLFLECAYTKRVWSAIANWARDTNLVPTQWTALGSILDWWMEIRLIEQASNRKGQETLIILTFWQIWKERNIRIFQHQRNEVPGMVAVIKEEAQAWIT